MGIAEGISAAADHRKFHDGTVGFDTACCDGRDGGQGLLSGVPRLAAWRPGPPAVTFPWQFSKERMKNPARECIYSGETYVENHPFGRRNAGSSDGC